MRRTYPDGVPGYIAVMESTELLHRALDHATAVVEGVKPDQMSSKTPCSEFDVRTLLNHTTASVQAFAGATEMFGPSVPASDDAPPADRLAAFLGRTPRPS